MSWQRVKMAKLCYGLALAGKGEEADLWALPAAQLPAGCEAARLSDRRSEVATDKDEDAELGLMFGSVLADSATAAALFDNDVPAAIKNNAYRPRIAPLCVILDRSVLWG